MTEKETMEIEAKYNELRKKYKLPDYKVMDNELEISTIEQESFLLRSIMRRILEKVDFFMTILQDTIQPDASNMVSMNETNFFDDDEKKNMYTLYKKLASMNREGALVSLNPEEKSEAEFINTFFEHWEQYKKELQHFIKKMRDSWKADIDEDYDVRYVG